MWKFLDLKPEMFGMDISDSSVKIIKLKKKHPSFEVETFGQTDLEPGIVEAGEIKNEQALVKAIKKVCSEAKGKKLNTKYVVASLPEEKSFLEVIQMPVMKEEELSGAIVFEAENHIPFPIDQVYLDFQIIPAEINNPGVLDVLIVAMPRTTVDSYVNCIKKAGLISCILDTETQAIARSIIKDEENSLSLIIVNFGKKNSNFAIFSGRSIKFTSSVQVSSSQVTEAISKEMNVSLQEAEKIKISFSLLKREESEDSKRIYRSILPVLNGLAIQIKKYFSFYRDHVSRDNAKEPATEKIILTGGGSNLDGLAEFISKETSIKTELGSMATNLSAGAEKITSGFCTAVGLAIRAINKKQ